MNSRWSRRDFLKSTAAAMFFSGAEKALGATQSLPKRRLGKTGEIVSCIGFGSGTRFCSIPEEDAAQALLERALALGVSYFDTAGSYTRRGIERLSEKRLGEFSKKRRKEIFLATKIDPRDRDGALRSVEQSLKFLQTDYLDLIQIHSLNDLSDLDRIGGARQRARGRAAIEGPESGALHRHHRSQPWHGYGRGVAPPRLRYSFNGAQRGAIRQPDRRPQNDPDPCLRTVGVAARAGKAYGHSLDESYGTRNACR